MRHVRVGSLSASVIGLGCNQLGPTVDRRGSVALVDAALDAGINFFDVADEYGPEGRAEEYLGEAVKGRRDKVLVATKFGHHMDGDPGRGGASARWIRQAVQESLRRLGTDYIDLYQQHFPDDSIPPEETLGALDELVKAGKVREIGVCNLPPTAVAGRIALAGGLGLHQLASVQDRYNLLRQRIGASLLEVTRPAGLAFLPFFPLAAGMLSGKYRFGEPPPADSRFGIHIDPAQARHMIDRDAAQVATLSRWADRRGRRVTQLALAWLASQDGVGPVIAGASRPEQVSANAAAAEWLLGPEEIAEVARLVSPAR